jgi:small subunit ribosomal protein S2
MKEHIAVAEALKLNIPIFAIVDTNSDPRKIDFPIPANDDASKSIDLIMTDVVTAIAEGLNERKAAKEENQPAKEKPAATEEKPAE